MDFSHSWECVALRRTAGKEHKNVNNGKENKDERPRRQTVTYGLHSYMMTQNRSECGPCGTYALAMDRQRGFESTPGVRVRREVSQQGQEARLARSHRGGEGPGCSQHLLHTGWIITVITDATASPLLMRISS